VPGNSLVIDEVQVAPTLFRAIKADRRPRREQIVVYRCRYTSALWSMRTTRTMRSLSMMR